jgi:glycosyltransferase involved in cell wall biosynthesis
MKILCFNWRDITHPMAGGAEVYFHEIAKRLANEHDVVLFCGKYKGCKARDEIDGIRIRRHGGSFLVYLYAIFHYLVRLRSQHYDLVIDSINGIPFFTPLFCRRPKVAIVHHLVKKDVFFKELPFPLALVGWLAERSIRFIYRQTPIVTVSPSSRRELVEFGIAEQRIHTVYNAIDRAELGCGAKSSRPVVAYVGRIKRYKQIEHLLQAFELVKKEVPEAEAVIAGRGDYTILQRIIDDSQAGSYVKLKGEVPEGEKAEILKQAWAFVIPSAKEGWGISVIEANACATPAIAYDVPGLRDSVRHGETGMLVPSGDINQLANSMVLMLTDEQLRARMSRNALEWSSEFSWDKSAGEFNDIVVRIVSDCVSQSGRAEEQVPSSPVADNRQECPPLAGNGDR